MKLSVFRPVILRLQVLRINTINTWQTETAYFGERWGNVLSTVIYTLTYLVFISAIYANVRTLAGYTRDQMLFLVLLGQINFYLLFGWSFNNMQKLVEDVNRGSFDLLLVKPLPVAFYVSVRNISLLPILTNGLPALLFVCVAINWRNIAVEPVNLLLGIIVLIAGQLALNTFLFFLAAPVFWSGRSTNLLSFGLSLLTNAELPYQGITRIIRFMLTFLIPALIPTSLTASVMLGKSDPVLTTGLALSAVAILLLVRIFVWNKALLNYTSASS